MKKAALVILTLILANVSEAQQKKWVNPIVKGYGRILDLEDVDVKPDPNMKYNILIELVNDMDKPNRVDFYANNVARLINLHAVGGVPKENLNVTLVIHAQATNSVLNSEKYKAKYKEDSPYEDFYKALNDAGVEVIVCGQSLSMFGHKPKDVLPDIKIATSALTVMSTYQQKGYSFFKMGG